MSSTYRRQGNRERMLDHLNSINDYIKFTVETPDEAGGVPFLDTKPTPTGNKIQCSVYRKPTHTDRYLDWRSNHPLSAKKSVVRALSDRAKNVCTSPEILAKEMDHLHSVLRSNHYPEWILKQSKGPPKPRDPPKDPTTGEEIKKLHFISVPYYPGLSEEFRRIFTETTAQICFKGQNTLKSLLMHPKDKIPDSIKQNVIYKWTCTEPSCQQSYIGESSRCLQDRAKEHAALTASTNTSAIHLHSQTTGHPRAKLEDFKIIDQASHQVAREARESLHIRKDNPPLNKNIGKMTVPVVFNNFLGIPSVPMQHRQCLGVN